jgi:Tol biopolymer transport system component/DNA-binding winged helix-turn-helix (wHTH) protein
MVRFGIFEADFQTGELRKAGVRIRVQSQPMLVLAALVERPGELVSREDLQGRLWPGVSALDFEHGLNMAVKKLRAALNDSAETPRYIETLARKGYRFIAPVEGVETGPSIEPDVPAITGTLKHAPPGTRLMIAGLATVVVLAAVEAMLRQSPQAKVTQLITLPGVVFQTAFSPDGEEVIFTQGTPGERAKLFIKATGIAPPRRLTDEADANVAESLAAWIPDGSGISYLRRVPPARASLYAVPITGGTPRKLMDVGENRGYSWMPGGKSLAISVRGPAGRFVIYSVEPGGGEKQQISNPPVPPSNSGLDVGGDEFPRYSPDGGHLAFVRQFSDRRALMVMPAKGGAPSELGWFGGHSSSYAWTPDSREIVYTGSGAASPHTLNRVDTGGGTSHPLSFVAPGTDVSDPAVSAKGLRMAYVITSQRTGIWRYSLAPGNAAAPQRVAVSDGGQSDPAFSPDGKKFAFSSDRSGNWEIYVSDVEGKHPVQLTAFGRGGTGSAKWSPDGKRIVFDARPGGRAQIYTIDAEGGDAHVLVDARGDAVMPEWSPDGHWVYYTQTEPDGHSEIWKVPASGGASARVTTQGAYGGFPSPDGLTLYIAKRSEAGLYAVPISGGPEQKVVDRPQAGRMAPGKSGVYFLANVDTGGSELLRYSYATGKVARLMTFDRPPQFPALAIAPDESIVLYAQLDDVLSKVMLVENFR